MRISLLFVVLFIGSCVTLPDEHEQAAELARQSFGANYNVAITSFYIRESNPRWWRDWSDNGERYNLGDTTSSIERCFADAIQSALNVTPVFIPRSEIQERMDKEFLARTAAIHAKEIAAEAGHDAIAIIYFARQLA